MARGRVPDLGGRSRTGRLARHPGRTPREGPRSGAAAVGRARRGHGRVTRGEHRGWAGRHDRPGHLRMAGNRPVGDLETRGGTAVGSGPVRWSGPDRAVRAGPRWVRLVRRWSRPVRAWSGWVRYGPPMRTSGPRFGPGWSRSKPPDQS